MADSLTRRQALRLIGLVGPAALAAPVAAEERYTIGLVTGPAGDAFVAGAALGLDEGNVLAGFFGKRIELARGTAEGAAAGPAAERLVRDARAVALVGGDDDGAANALRDVAARAGVLFFNVGADGDALRAERCHRHAFHVVPSRAMYLDALARVLVGDRRLGRWAVVAPDSRAAGIDSVRRAVTRQGGAVVGVEALGTAAVPALFVRLSAATPDVVFVALGESAVSDLARQAREAGFRGTLAGVGHPALSPDEATGAWVTAWHPELTRFSARELNARFRRRFGRPLGDDSWAAWAALKMLAEAIVRAGAVDTPGLIRYFETAPRFDGHKGEPLTFRDWDHQLSQPVYVLGPRKETGDRREPLTVVAQVPPPGEALEAIGVAKGETQCRL